VPVRAPFRMLVSARVVLPRFWLADDRARHCGLIPGCGATVASSRRQC
jgi:hypothetical protein